MPKVRKYSKGLFVSIPESMATSLGIKEGDELEFIKNSETSFVVAKKNDLLKLLDDHRETLVSKPIIQSRSEIDEKELGLLKKLDTFRYNERVKDKVDSMLSDQEKSILRRLMERKMVTLYRKDPKEQFKYSIPRDVYDKFLYRKGKKEAVVAAATPTMRPKGLDKSAVRKWDDAGSAGDYMSDLETNGYVVLKNEADAASASAALEDSIKQGLVIGTRAFDKKFYIGLRGFINKNAPKILKALDGRTAKAEELASELGINYDGVKTVLYILAESGDITEVRRDIFRIA